MLLTDQGQFESLAHLRYAYLQTYQGKPPVHWYLREGEWDDSTLHISELGKCPRAQMYRLMGAEKKAKAISTCANEELMFWQGNMIHALTVGALEWAGVLVAFEQQLKGLPIGWSGHFDAIFHDHEEKIIVGWDGKTVRSNAFDYAYSWPKPEHEWQVQGYMCFIPDVAYWYIEYIDRGGARSPQYRVIHRDDAKVSKRMHELDVHRANLDRAILPPVLPPEFTLYYRKVNNEMIRRYNSVSVGPSWQCEWCDYHHGTQDKKDKQWTTFEDSPCQPDMTKMQVGKTEKNFFKCISPAHEESLTLWLKSQVLEYAIKEEDVE